MTDYSDTNSHPPYEVCAACHERIWVGVGHECPAIRHDEPVLVSAAHHSEGKPEVAELDPSFIEEMGRVMAYGRVKYPNDPDGMPNWWKGGRYRSFLASIMRHTLALMRGENMDYGSDCPGCGPEYCPEHSGLHHAAHIAVDAMFLFSWWHRHVGTDDRLKR